MAGRSRAINAHDFPTKETLAPELMVTLCRDLSNMDDLHFGIQQEMLYARNTPPVPGAQWTGIVTQIAIEMLTSGKVEAVVCVQVNAVPPAHPPP